MRNCHHSHYIHCRNNLLWLVCVCFFLFFFISVKFSLQSSFGLLCVTQGARNETRRAERKTEKSELYYIFTEQEQNHIILIC